MFKWNEDLITEDIICHFWQKGDVRCHSHLFYEIFLITEGRVYHEYNGITRLIGAGELFLIPPGAEHGFRSYENESSVHFNIKLTPELYRTLALSISPSLCSSVENKRGEICYLMAPYELEFFKRTFEEHILFYAQKTEAQTTALMKAMASSLLSYVNLSLGREETKYPTWFSDFISKISREEVFPLPLSEIYGMSPYSQTRLNYYFREFTGDTMISYITKRKLAFAKNLLRSTNYTILYISERCGFNNLSNFNRAFKKETGKTPSEFRRLF